MRIASLSGPAIENLRDAASKAKDQYNVQVEQVEGEERLSGPFRYTVQFQLVEDTGDGEENGASGGGQGTGTSSGGGPNFDEIVGKEVVLTFHRSMAGGQRSDARAVSGIVTKIRQHGKGVGKTELTTTSFIVEIRPVLWRLQLSKSNRSFSNRPIVKDESAGNADEGILNELLGGHLSGTHLTDGYQKRKNVVQHNETDLEFMNRIAEEAGVVYYFDENGQVVLVDNNDDEAYRSYRRFERASNNSQGIEKRQDLKPVPSSNRDDEGALRTYAFEQNLIPNLMAAQSYDYEKGGMSAKMTGSTSATGGQEAMGMLRETPGGLNWHVDKSPEDVWENGQMQRRRVDQLQSAQKVLRGTTGSRLLGAGMQFELQGSTCGDVLSHFPSAGDAMQFVVARTVVRGRQGSLDVEFEAFPKRDDTKTTSPNYRGDRYAERRSGVEEDTEAIDVDPYTLSTAPAVATSNPKIQSGIYTAKVDEVPGGGSDKARKGMVKVDLVSKNGGKPWARVVSFWASGQHGAQHLPREGDTVAVSHPGQDSNQDVLVMGSLYDGARPMPFAENPKKSGFRSHSRRENDGTDLHNEISMNDEPESEELRSLAPNERTDVTGVERKVGDESTYFAFKKEKAPSGLQKKDGTSLEAEKVREQFNPTAPRFVTEEEKNRHMPAKTDKVCELKPISVQIKVEYEGVEEKNISNKKIKESKLPSSKKTKFKVKEEIGESVKKEINKSITLEEFMYELSEEKQGERKMKIKSGGEEKNIWWYTVENEEEVSEYISYEAYSELGETVRYTLYKKEGGKGQDKSGKGNLADDMQKTSEGTYASIEIKDGGAKPLYEVVGSREAYEVDSWGQDAYNVHPYKELYPDKKKIKNFKGQGAKRTEYTEGGAIDACQGTYRIHSFGDRLEVFKASKDDQKSVFEQEVSDEWEVEDLPGEHDQFEDDDPIMVLNEDGSIVIQSSEGINIESSEDINIQSSGSINMYAEESIKQEAEEEISEVAKEIKIGDEKETHSIEQRSKHHYSRQTGVVQKDAQETMTIKNENIVLSTAYLHMSLAKAVHMVGGPVSIKIAPFDSGNTVLDLSLQTIVSRIRSLKDAISSIKSGSFLLNDKEQISSTSENIVPVSESVLKSQESIINNGENAVGEKESAVKDSTAAFFLDRSTMRMHPM